MFTFKKEVTEKTIPTNDTEYVYIKHWEKDNAYKLIFVELDLKTCKFNVDKCMYLKCSKNNISIEEETNDHSFADLSLKITVNKDSVCGYANSTFTAEGIIPIDGIRDFLLENGIEVTLYAKK